MRNIAVGTDQSVANFASHCLIGADLNVHAVGIVRALHEFLILAILLLEMDQLRFDLHVLLAMLLVQELKNLHLRDFNRLAVPVLAANSWADYLPRYSVVQLLVEVELQAFNAELVPALVDLVLKVDFHIFKADVARKHGWVSNPIGFALFNQGRRLNK